MTAEHAELLRHIEALARDRWPHAPRLTDAERAEVHRLLDRFSRERAEQVTERVALIERVAYGLGQRVARHDTTRTAAAEQLDALASHLDPQCPVPLALISYADALDTGRRAFASGYAKASHDEQRTQQQSRRLSGTRRYRRSNSRARR
jgi:hypothetical protein